MKIINNTTQRNNAVLSKKTSTNEDVKQIVERMFEKQQESSEILYNRIKNLYKGFNEKKR